MSLFFPFPPFKQICEIMFDMPSYGPIPSPLGAVPPTKQVLPEVVKLRRAIEQGELERREELVGKLGELALSLAAETRYDDALKAFDELIELTETLLEEGQIEITETMTRAMFPISNIARTANIQFQHENRREVHKYDDEAFFKRAQKCFALLPEEEFLRIKNEWAMDISSRAESLHKSGATIAAIALLDESLQVIERHFNAMSGQFTERKPLLDIYRLRGEWKCEIGDQQAGIADLLKYEMIANVADDLLEASMAASRESTRNATMQDGKLVVRLQAEDYLDFFASYHFQIERYEALLYLAGVYHGRAEKEKALEYYDKALAVVQNHQDHLQRKNFMFFVAPMDVPYRKGELFAGYHEHEKALEQFDLALENAKELLKSEHRGQYSRSLEDHLATITRAKADALRNLGRFDEAKEATELTKKLFAQAVNPRETLSDNPLSVKNLLASKNAKQKGKKPNKQAFMKDGKFSERETMMKLGLLHNEATMDLQQGMIEMHQGNWRKAVRYLLKARFIIDSPVVIAFPEAKKNVYSIYASLARLYSILKEYEKSQLWYERSERYAQTLIDEGEMEFRDHKCLLHDGHGVLYADLEQYDKALAAHTKAFTERQRLIEEQEAALEGLDREHLRLNDNQKLMPLAVLYKAQVETVRSLQVHVFALDMKDAAAEWARIEMESFENLRALLLEPAQADRDCIMATGSCAASLRWCGQEEQCQELLERWIASYKDKCDSEDDARKSINLVVAMRLRDLYAVTDFGDGAKLYTRMLTFKKQGQPRETYEVIRVLRSLLVHEQGQLPEDAPFIKQEFYKQHLLNVDEIVKGMKDEGSINEEEENAYLNHPYNPDEVRAILEQIEKEEEEEEDRELEEDQPDEDENAALYERDYENAMDNQALIFKMMDAVSGNDIADDIIDRMEPIRNTSPKVGRNDPCPCGSGKKYKKCCLK